MKKAIISILVILPLVLVVIIAITGRIYGNYEYIKVESIVFVDTNGDKLEDEITIEVGRSKIIEFVINPRLASNPNLTFSSSNANYCSVSSTASSSGRPACIVKALGVDETGKVTVDVTANSIDNVSESIKVNIVQSGTSSIKLSQTNVTGYVGLKAMINATTVPSSEAQNLVWASSDNNVVEVNGVGGKGILTFKGQGEAIITVKTSDGLEQKCYIKVLNENYPMFKNKSNIVENKEIDLLEYVQNNDLMDIHFEIISGNAIINENKLISNGNGLVTVKLYVDDVNLNYDEAKFLFK